MKVLSTHQISPDLPAGEVLIYVSTGSNIQKSSVIDKDMYA